MNLAKSEVKIEVVNDLGNRLDDMKEANEKDLYRLEGAIKAFQSMGEALDGLFKVVDEELEEGKFDLEASAHIKRYVKRAHQMSINLTMQSENKRFIQMGKIQGSQAAVQIAQKIREDEMAKMATIAAALEAQKEKTGKIDLEEAGRSQRMSIKEQRLAEDAAEQSKAQPKEITPTEPQEKAKESSEVKAEESAEEPKAKKAPTSKGRWASGRKRATNA